MDPEAEKDRHRPENWIVRYVLGVADHLRASDKTARSSATALTA